MPTVVGEVKPRKDIQIIELFASKKNISFNSPEEKSSFIKRNLRAAGLLTAYDIKRIEEVINFLSATANFKYTLESVGKYIDEDLNNLINRQSKIALIG